eukprot:4347548-Pleurochrysis_carterae.AAC.7
MVASKERFEALLNLRSGGVAQVEVDFEVRGRKVVEAQHVAEANECNLRAAADSAGRSRRVGRRSRASCGGDWHRACGLEKQRQEEKLRRSSSSDDCANALLDGDAERWLRA